MAEATPILPHPLPETIKVLGQQNLLREQVAKVRCPISTRGAEEKVLHISRVPDFLQRLYMKGEAASCLPVTAAPTRAPQQEVAQQTLLLFNWASFGLVFGAWEWLQLQGDP